MKLPDPLNTILFDMDGTLFDTAPDLALSLNQLLKRYNHPPLPYSQIRPFASEGTRGLLQLGFGIDTTHGNFQELRGEFLKIYKHHLHDQTQLFEGMSELIQFIEAQDLRWGVVTNKPTHYARIIMEHFKLMHRSACLVGGDLVKQLKPAPDSLILACDILKIQAKQCIYIGDAERDILAAKAAGMRSIAALYGYIQGTENPLRWNADDYVQRPSDILPLIQNLLLTDALQAS